MQKRQKCKKKKSMQKKVERCILYNVRRLKRCWYFFKVRTNSKSHEHKSLLHPAAFSRSHSYLKNVLWKFGSGWSQTGGWGTFCKQFFHAIFSTFWLLNWTKNITINSVLKFWHGVTFGDFFSFYQKWSKNTKNNDLGATNPIPAVAS